MKHHNKFKVRSDPSIVSGYEIKYAMLGGFSVPFNGALDISTIEIDELSLEALLNSVYDQAYQNGRIAVRNALTEAMGFDGE